MLTFDKQIKYRFDACQQCGTCLAVCPTGAVSTRIGRDGLARIEIDSVKCIACKRCVCYCPSAQLSPTIDFRKTTPKKHYFLGHNNDPVIRKHSSSGGVARTLLIEGLKSGMIEGAYSLKKIEEYPYASGTFYTANNIPAYRDLPNSIYHSVMLNRQLNEIEKCGRLLIIGTRCQLRGVEKILKGKYDELIKVCIFCKQQKSLDSTRFLSKAMGNSSLSAADPFEVRYRGEGWPGTVSLKTAAKNSSLPWATAAQLPFGRRLWTVPGCNRCDNPFGDDADITLLDPWSIEQANDQGNTLIIVHTPKGEKLLREMPGLELTEKNFDEIQQALDLRDIGRKQALTAYFRHEKVTFRIRLAGRAERFQRWYLSSMVKHLPRMPILFYRILCKIPDLRNILLK